MLGEGGGARLQRLRNERIEASHNGRGLLVEEMKNVFVVLGVAAAAAAAVVVIIAPIEETDGLNTQETTPEVPW